MSEATFQEKLDSVDGLIQLGYALKTITGESPLTEAEYKQAVAIIDLAGETATAAFALGYTQEAHEALEIGKRWVTLIATVGSDEQNQRFGEHLLENLFAAE